MRDRLYRVVGARLEHQGGASMRGGLRAGLLETADAVHARVARTAGRAQGGRAGRGDVGLRVRVRAGRRA